MQWVLIGCDCHFTLHLLLARTDKCTWCWTLCLWLGHSFCISEVKPSFQLHLFSLSLSLHPSVLLSLKITPGSAAKQRDILIKDCHSSVLPQPNHIINISVSTSKHLSWPCSSIEDSYSLNSKAIQQQYKNLIQKMWKIVLIFNII